MDRRGSDNFDTTTGACLVLIADGVGHGYDIARHFVPEGSLGAVITHSRPVVYRAIKQLESAGLVRSTEATGSRGQLKWTLSCTAAGQEAARTWLNKPVAHLRDLRGEFLVKFLLLERMKGDVRGFVHAQRAALDTITAGLIAKQSRDATALWRREQARAAVRFLDELEGSVAPTDEPSPSPMSLSARNQLRAKVTRVTHGDILSSVRVSIDAGQEMTSTITREAADSLRLAPGTPVVALCKATDVMLATEVAPTIERS